MTTKSTKMSLDQSALVHADTHVESFRKARQARRLIADGGEARQVDLSARLGVAQPTVAKMLKRLAEDGFVAQRPYRGVFLTEAGKVLAEKSRRRHLIVECFLRALGISPETACIDAEGIEHHVSSETLDAFERFLRKQRWCIEVGRGGATG